MFERLELKYEESFDRGYSWHFETDINKILYRARGIITVIYDETENKTYGYFQDNSIKPKGVKKIAFVRDGNSLIEELENTDFRNWSPVRCYDRGTPVEWTIEYNDINEPSQYYNHDLDAPKEFHDFILILDKYFKKADFSKLKELEYNGNFNDTIDFILRQSKEWKANKKNLKLLRKLTDFIPLLSNQSIFGTWTPKKNTEEYYSSENHFVFSEEVKQFKSVILEIEANLKKEKYFIHMGHLSLLPDILELKNVADRYLINNRMAVVLLIKYIYEYGYYDYCTSYAYEEAFRNGTITMILEFIKAYNHF